MQRDTANTPNQPEIEYTLRIEDDVDVRPEDDLDNPEALAYVRNQIEEGNPWAWCVVEVRASLEGCSLQGSAYLGGCSYDSEDDFRRSDYFKEMCAEAREDLEGHLEAAAQGR